MSKKNTDFKKRKGSRFQEISSLIQLFILINYYVKYLSLDHSFLTHSLQIACKRMIPATGRCLED